MTTMRPLRVLSAACALALAPMLAMAGPKEDALVERLVEAHVMTLPIGRIMQGIAAQDAGWPAGDREDITPAQLACLRREISPAGQRVLVRPRMAEYVAADAARAERDLRVIEAGAGQLFGDLVMAGANAEATGEEADAASVMAKASPEAQASFLAFFQADEHAGAREAFGLDGLASRADGQDFGARLALQLMQHGFEACDVSMAP